MSDSGFFDAEFIADPHPVLAKLRDEAPARRVVTPDGAPVWLVTRYADVRALLADPRLSLDSRHSRTTDGLGSSLPDVLQDHLLNMDPPDHTRIRKLAAQAFTARRTERLRGRITAETSHLLDHLDGRHTADLIAEFASPLPLTVICDMLGIPATDRPNFRSWTNTLLDPDPLAPRRARAAMTSMHELLVTLIARKRAEPADDVLTALVTARDIDDTLTDGELEALVFLILFGGYDTTASAIGTAAFAVLSDPRHGRLIRDGALEITSVVDEALRWNTPFANAVRRFAREDIDLDGTTIPAGDRVWLSLTSANRDQRQYSNPDVFDPGRIPNPHLAFGHGIHYCLGAPLARMQTQIAITALLRRFPAMTLVDPGASPRWRESFRARGLRELPVIPR